MEASLRSVLPKISILSLGQESGNKHHKNVGITGRRQSSNNENVQQSPSLSSVVVVVVVYGLWWGVKKSGQVAREDRTAPPFLCDDIRSSQWHPPLLSVPSSASSTFILTRHLQPPSFPQSVSQSLLTMAPTVII